MRWEKGFIFRIRVGKKLLSVYVVSLMLLASFVGIMPSVEAAPPPDVMTTYFYDGGLNIETEFDDDNSVYVNVSVNNTSGDPVGSFYSVRAENMDSGEWVLVNVTDNQTFPVPSNVENDSIYWGVFNISSFNVTHNSTGPGDFSILNAMNEDTINISEYGGGI